jgi:peptidyl-prolyl cis-trans isomerase C
MQAPQRLGIVGLVGWLAILAWGQAPSASQPASSGQTPQTSPADEVAVTVNGHPILESEVGAQVRARTPQKLLDNPRAAAMLKQYRGQVVDRLISNYLLDVEVERAGIVVSDEEMGRIVEEELRGYLANNGITAEQFDAELYSERGLSLADFLAQRRTDPSLRQGRRHAKLVATKFPEAVKVTEEDVEQYYRENSETRYMRPELVRASQILIGTEGMTPEQKAEARKKAEDLLAQARRPGADFAALAREHSTHVSKARGGDVGFFTLRGKLPESFTAAAFGLKVGEISDVVETKYGYHIIKVTDRLQPTPISLEDARPGARLVLERKKEAEELKRYVAELRQAAHIVYPPGKEPEPPAPREVPAGTIPGEPE